MQNWVHNIKNSLLLYSCLFVYPHVYLFAEPPKVEYLFPAGGKAGTQVAITATGEFSTWPVKVACDRTDIIITPDKEKGKFLLDLAEQAPPGIAWLRFYNEEGASSLRPFIIGNLPESEEKEPNEGVENAQVITRNVVMNGCLGKANDVDGFLLELAAGEKFTAAVQAHSVLGSPLDAMLQVCELVPRRTSAMNDSPKLEAFVLEQNHDSLGLDPAIHFVAPRTGKYLLRLFAIPSEPNSSISFAGKENYIYRLTVTDREFDASKLLPVVHEKFPVITEPNPNNQPLALPVTIASYFAANAPHNYSFTAQKGKKVTFSTATSTLGFSTDLALKVLNSQGMVLAEGERMDPKKELELGFNPPVDGTFTLQTEEVNQHTGPSFAYRIQAIAAEQAFELTAAIDAFALQPDKPLEISITVDRRFGFSQRIEIRAESLPPGITAEPVFSEAKGDSSKIVKLIIKASAEAQATSVPFTLSGTADTITRPVMYSTALPLDQKHADFWLTVKK